MNRIITLIFSCIATISCIAQTSIKDSDVSQGSTIALRFANEYVALCSQRNGSEDDWIAKNKLVTNHFKSSYKKLIKSALKKDPELGLGFDPIFDAQDYPDKGFKIHSYDCKTGLVTLEGEDWADFILVLRVVKQKDKWLVDGSGVLNIPINKRGKR